MTYWSDISSYQPVVDDSYPWSVLAVRSSDGDYRDPHFSANYAWGLRNLASGRLKVLLVYFVWRPNVVTTVNTHLAMLGATHPGVVSMIDVESWGGQISGDQSAGINQAHSMLAAHWGDPRRVIGYGNRGDLNALWPHRPNGLRLVVASYGPPIAYPGMIAQQVTDGVNGPVTSVAPFGRADVNRSDLTADQLAAALGVGAPASHGENMVTNYEINGTGDLPLDCPVGKASAVTAAAWLSASLGDGTHGTIQVWFQSDTAGISEVDWTLNSANGHSNRCVAGLPDGTTEVNVHYQLNGPGVITLETQSK
jgi:hypothetical protein